MACYLVGGSLGAGRFRSWSPQEHCASMTRAGLSEEQKIVMQSRFVWWWTCTRSFCKIVDILPSYPLRREWHWLWGGKPRGLRTWRTACLESSTSTCRCYTEKGIRHLDDFNRRLLKIVMISAFLAGPQNRRSFRLPGALDLVVTDCLWSSKSACRWPPWRPGPVS